MATPTLPPLTPPPHPTPQQQLIPLLTSPHSPSPLPPHRYILEAFQTASSCSRSDTNTTCPPGPFFKPYCTRPEQASHFMCQIESVISSVCNNPSATCTIGVNCTESVCPRPCIGTVDSATNKLTCKSLPASAYPELLFRPSGIKLVQKAAPELLAGSRYALVFSEALQKCWWGGKGRSSCGFKIQLGAPLDSSAIISDGADSTSVTGSTKIAAALGNGGAADAAPATPAGGVYDADGRPINGTSNNSGLDAFGQPINGTTNTDGGVYDANGRPINGTANPMFPDSSIVAAGNDSAVAAHVMAGGMDDVVRHRNGLNLTASAAGNATDGQVGVPVNMTRANAAGGASASAALLLSAAAAAAVLAWAL